MLSAALLRATWRAVGPAVLLVGAAMVLGGCGQKGPLTRPDLRPGPVTGQHQPPQSTTPPATAASAASLPAASPTPR